MVLMPPVRLLRSATKALRNSIANTAASSANLLCETFEHFFLRVKLAKISDCFLSASLESFREGKRHHRLVFLRPRFD
jgi:hypothetical protein